MTTPTLDQILHDVRSLPRKERARLIGLLAEELAEQPVEAAPTPADSSGGWDRFWAVVTDIRATYPNADISGRLEADRREREETMLGKASDVHD